MNVFIPEYCSHNKTGEQTIMVISSRNTFLAALAFIAFQAQAVNVTVAYQTSAEPAKVAQADNTFAKESGATVDWRKFDSGASIVRALDIPESICFVAPAGHPLAAKDAVTLEELARQEFLLTERGMSYRDALDQVLEAHQLSIKPYLELGSAALLCQMVERGLGLSFLPEYIVRDALAAGRVARLNVPDCTVTMRRQLFYHKDKWLTPQMKAFMELAQQSPAEGTC